MILNQIWRGSSQKSLVARSGGKWLNLDNPRAFPEKTRKIGKEFFNLRVKIYFRNYRIESQRDFLVILRILTLRLFSQSRLN